MKGYVLSDLHLYTQRTAAVDRMVEIRDAAAVADFLVLNGDVVDFKWSTIGNTEATIVAAVEWLRNLCAINANCQVRYVMGNHDAHAAFAEALTQLAAVLDNFAWHPTHLRLGPSLFHHGDLLLAGDPSRYWSRPLMREVTVQSTWRNWLYDQAIAARLHQLPALIHTPRRIAARIARALTRPRIAEFADLTDVYIGHTHTPFTGVCAEGLRIHNTGSTIKKLAFNMLDLNIDKPEPIL